MTHSNTSKTLPTSIKYFDLNTQAQTQLNDDDFQTVINNIKIAEADVNQLFNTTDNTIFIDINKILPTRCRINGVINASAKMLDAKNGLLEKRKPLSIKKHADNKQRYLLMDGNSTYFVALFWGIKKLPCELAKNS